MKFSILLVFLVINLSSLFAQMENKNWHFGYHAGLDFNSGSAQSISNGIHSFFEGCSSISDLNGNVLFYTDGIKVYDKNNNIMPNGDSLAGGESTTQSAIIVSHPGYSYLYYVFTIQQQYTSNEFSYSIIDITQNNGNGDVTIKNVLIASSISEKLAALKHPNNIDVWVMVHGLGNNNFYCYALTTSGLSLVPVTSSVGTIIPVDSISGDSGGQMKFSMDCTKIAYAAVGSNYVALFDFDPYSGVVSNEIYLALPQVSFPSSGAYGLEFSPNGAYLYCSIVLYKIYQWNISSGIPSTIIASRKQKLTSNVSNGSLQLAPDGKIYLAKYPSSYLGEISFPDLQMPQCNYIDSGAYLGQGNNGIYGLPNFMIRSCQFTNLMSDLQEVQLTIYPNVSQSKINIKYENILSIDIINSNGISVQEIKYSFPGIKNVELDVSELRKGLYFIKVGYHIEKFVVF